MVGGMASSRLPSPTGETVSPPGSGRGSRLSGPGCFGEGVFFTVNTSGRRWLRVARQRCGKGGSAAVFRYAEGELSRAAQLQVCGVYVSGDALALLVARVRRVG